MTQPSLDRVYWSCRRGMLELDLILIPFYQHQYQQLDNTLQHYFRDLLECPDAELYAWLTGRTQPEEPHLLAIVQKIRAYAIDPTRPRTL